MQHTKMGGIMAAVIFLSPLALVMVLYAAWPRIALAIDSKKDFIDVSAMLGTWAAVGAALYIALSDRKQRYAGDILAAQLTAASITYRLGLLRAAAISVRDFAQSKLSGDIYPSHFLMYASTLDSVARCTFDEMRALTALGENCALNIAAAQDRIDIARNFLQKESLPISTIDEQIRSLGIIVTALTEAEQLLAAAIGTCEQAGGSVSKMASK